MSAASTEYAILSAVQGVVAGLGLAFNAVPVPVNLRKVPAAQETLDSPLPVICVCRDDKPVQFEKLGFTGSREGIYPVHVVIVAANNRDNLTNLDVYANWIQQIRDAFRGPLLAGVASVWDTFTDDLALVDPSLSASDYDLSGLTLTFHTSE